MISWATTGIMVMSFGADIMENPQISIHLFTLSLRRSKTSQEGRKDQSERQNQ